MSARLTRGRLIGFATVAAGAVLTVVAGTGVAASLPTSAPAAGGRTAAFASGTPALTPLRVIAADAQTAVDRGRAASVDAAAVSSDIGASGLDLGVDTSIDTSALESSLDRLSGLDTIPLMLLPDLTDAAVAKTAAVAQRVTALRTALDAARAAKAAAEAAAAAAAAAEAAAEAQRQAEAAAEAEREAQAEAEAEESSGGFASAPPVGPVDPGSVQGIAREMAASRGWGDDQFACLVALWDRESGWNYQAYNPSSGAGGIPQALPASKMASAGDDWASNPATQITWGLNYIAGSYGSPCAAWDHSESSGWY